MQRDRLIRPLLLTIALLLAANIVAMLWNNKSVSLNVLPTAHAQRNTTTSTPRNYTVKTVTGFTVDDLKDVVSIGDGKTFVVSNTKGFMVYQVQPSR